MKACRAAMLVLGGLVTVLLSAAACSPSQPTATAPPAPQRLSQAAETKSYRVEVLLGPAQSPMGIAMTMTDQGRPVSHHLQIHIYDRASGVPLVGASPLVTLTEKATGASRQVTNVRECMPPDDHGQGPHYGDNLYLVSGAYTIAVDVRDETAVVEDVLADAAH